VIKFLLAAAVFPTALLLCWEGGKGVYLLAMQWRISFSFLGGAALYAAFHYLIAAPVRLYVAAHEFTHALAGMLCGYRIKDMSIGRDGGYVVVEGSNAFVALAPYCFPFYAVAAAVIYAGLSWKYDMAPYGAYFTAVTGFLMAFHFINTFETLYRQKQSDLRHAGGVFFSTTVILLCNGLLLLGSAKVFYPRLVDVRGAALDVCENTVSFWRFAGQKTAAGAVYLYDAVKK